ncbi:chemotaxis protein CheW [Natrinema sp. 74]|uniref:chemotaxis protein CheW n=1 Tax=Natrinema sp. 74 TaxID=3384159 RepID=UPI0038D4E92F
MGSASNRRNGTDDRVTVLTFDLEERRYCIRADAVASVLGIGDDDPLADADDPWNAGTITVAGERVTVVDLPRLFGSSFRTPTRIDDPQVLVLDIADENDRYYGWLVDEAGSTRSARPSSLEPPQLQTRYVMGRLEIDGAAVIWLDERAMHG